MAQTPGLIVGVHMELIDLQPVGGLCLSCLLPSMVRVTFAVRNDPGTIASGIASRVVCNQCGEPGEET